MTVAVPYVESGIAIAKVSRRVRLSSVFSSSHADDLLLSIDGAIEARMARLSTIGVDSMSPEHNQRYHSSRYLEVFRA